MENTVLKLPAEEVETIFLVNASSVFEFRMVQNWLAEQPNLQARERKAIQIADALHGSVEELKKFISESEIDPARLWLQPLRPVWHTEDSNPGEGSIWKDLFAGARYRPGPLRQKLIAKYSPDRVRIIEGQGAFLKEVQEQFDLTWKSRGVSESRLTEFVFRQALIALDRAERSVRGARYKVARLMPADITTNPEFQEKLGAIAGTEGKSLSKVEAESNAYLKEMAAMQTPFWLDLMIGLQRRACRSHHDDAIDFVPEELEQFRQWTEEGPVVVLVTHKSMLDTMALSCVLFDNNIPIPLAFGGINLATVGLGQLAQRSGIIFLRRAFQDNKVYKATFRRYVDYLLEKRFALAWALEGTRSRTGKLLPPRYGLTNYVIESILRTGQNNVKFVPVSVAYDQITEVEDYVIEQKGKEKRPEGAGWVVKFLRGGDKSHGKIYLRFGEPVTVLDIMNEEELAGDVGPDAKRRLVEQISLRAAFRMNKATPITLTALLTLILLSNGPRGRTLDGLTRTVNNWMRLVRARHIPIAGDDDLSTPNKIDQTLQALEDTGIVQRHETSQGPVFQIVPEQYHKAAYYRNTVIHFFVNDALIELALLAAANSMDSEMVFWREVLALRDMFKFEFYFEDRDGFLQDVRGKLAGRDERWQELLQRGGSEVRVLIDKSVPLVAQGVLRSFADAYQVMADHLVSLGATDVSDKKKLYMECLEIGQQALLLQRVFSAESVSKSLYQTAAKVADFRGLLIGDHDTIFKARVDFAEEVRGINRRLDIILGLTVSRQTD